MEPDFIISEEKVELLAKKTHDEIKFNSEEEYNNFIEKVYGKLKELEEITHQLGYKSNLRVKSNCESYDVYFADGVSAFRFLSFEIMEKKMESKNLLLTISNWLLSLEEDYTVFITNEYEETLDFYMMIVKSDKIYGMFEDVNIATRFGF